MEEKQLHHYLATLKRHKTRVMAIIGGIVVLALIVAISLPATYRSTGVILIEEQEIPSELVRSTITTFAAQRLQMINQRVMTRANLEKIITKFDLYAKDRKKLTSEEIIGKMRRDIAFSPISAEVIDPRTGQPSKATIAFSLSFDGPQPNLVQKVANEITSLYLEENLQSRSQKTAETSDFLTDEARQMGEHVSQVEQRLAEFKEQHLHNLPEQRELNLQFIDRTEHEISDIDNQLRTLEDRRIYLEGQLATLKPDSPVMSETGERILSPADRLKTLETKYLSGLSKYSEKHPDMIKMRNEIDAIRNETGETDTSMTQAKQLTQLSTELTALTQKYSDQHPEVIQLKKQIATLEGEINRHATQRAVRKIKESQPENPAYISLQTQRDSTVQDYEALLKRKTELKAKLGQYEKRLMETPDVERQYKEMVRDYENASEKYRELKAKQMEAEIAEQLEKKSKGERFSIVEPPMLPEKPVKPNRIAIFLLGLVLSLAGGAGYVFLSTSLDKTIRGTQGIALIAGMPPLVSIPLLGSHTEQEHPDRNIRKWLKWGGVAIGLLAVALLLIHLLVSPLDVLWFRGLRTMDKLVG